MKTLFLPSVPGRLALAALLLGLAPAARAQSSFAASVNYPLASGATPLGVAVADVNGDGRPDVVTGNQGTDNVGVLLGQASPAGTLGSPLYYSTGTGSLLRPTGVAVGDLNADGRPDIVAVNQNAGTVAVLLNSATAPGTFLAAVTYATGGSTPNLLRLADLDADGRLDIVVGNTQGNNLGVLLASATTPGTFRAVATYTVGSPLGIAIGDVNRDGRPDVVVAGYGTTGGVNVLLGSATTPGTLGSPATYSSGGNPTVDVALGDTNGDGYLDIVASNANSNSVAVLAGTATGTFGTATTYPVVGEPNLLALADLNGDGRLDITVANRTTGTVSVLTGRAAPVGTFAAAVTYAVGNNGGPLALTVADLNGDSRRDVVATNSTGGTVSVLLNTQTPLATTTPALVAAEVSLYPNPAHGTFTVQVPAVPGASTVAVELLNSLGQVVRRQQTALPATGLALPVDAAGLAAGVYALRLQAGAKVFMGRVVLE